MKDRFDYIVIGAGSSGCVTANRLVLEHDARVLLLEAGPSDNNSLIKIPAASFKMLSGSSPFVKRIASTPQASLGGRIVEIPQGNVVGGGSSVNIMLYARGSRLDYERWDQATDGAGWGWDDMVPYFRRQESNQRFENEAHGGDGPLKVSDAPYLIEADTLFLRTMQNLGVPFTADFNAGNLHGVGLTQSTIYKGKRCSAADAFLLPIIDDPRLTLVTSARVNRILFEGKRAVGVQYVVNGVTHERTTTGEVILTAGALVTPQLLMLSGIGPREHLEQHGIKPLVDLPGVGQNLQDHHVAILSATTKRPIGYFGEDRGVKALKNAIQYFAFKNSGPIGSTGSESMAFVNLDDPEADPDIQIYCVGVMYPSIKREPTDAVTLLANLVKPLSRGQVRLRSADPADHPEMNLGWLSNPEDSRRLLQALKYLRKITATEPFASTIDEVFSPSANLQSDEELMDYIHQTTESNYHPVGTCKMGLEDDPMSVVNADLKVIGVQNLRVFDCSMMPVIISANTNATAMAVADKGVDHMMGTRGRRVQEHSAHSKASEYVKG
ncbi:glucose-methanol-choline oxidoreductase [Pseudomonas agarici]|uniref:Glucose-methanol-choline oxidoreductase n=1 Tax=Pseudomonas agarici TaxID=46677 RepID=A0A0X1SZD3_PSEAA|nr:GMC family oxidoreductase N-terminal domain-containing protein [Pseudomonas agarici]AMB85174.1 glucose-methanol-choline oxidoreductase [Pseudomonas agarici]NWB94134.1 GMC family oxidoreductase N-terminal domain-containing protein [Pseudomonas agarici]NWC07936.1 GMC family oxidoreductase N-terminal domain-containing protein [Pseudomonas agarici]